ncbi:MAG: Asp-tRNA(Asn)/Glu-tRNA(Gln) amidotransferase subunit GatC [Flavobacteriia bacterium]|jgi:aspartyl-tRNA(Asn)/glutamyl-tRNA(Gln) amidotransferase subunit C|nr:Asp-tRNA(Asn)/Glu-tRNA(Gln) amidotransferase subunit GatC [Cryomorphaceae bacterium]
MKITEEIIDHIAHLSRLEFEGEDKKWIIQDLERIVGMMDTLKQIPTDDIEPLIFMTDEYNALREDVAEVSLSQQEVLKNAPKKDSDYFRIPKVLDK